MRAIETTYKGYRFRSRLEARWAVFFDALGVPYEYELQGYDLGEAGLYLPDFYLPTINLFVEVKGRSPTQDEIHKLEALTTHTGCDSTFRVGEPMRGVMVAEDRLGKYYAAPGYGGDMWCCSYMDPEASERGFGWDGPYLFCVCPKCGKVGLEFDGRGARVCGWQACVQDDKSYSGDHWRIRSAALAARGARFEHGESP